MAEYDLRRFQLIQLKLLDEFSRICNKNEIPFFLVAGSCLGAVRHGGFIPWDGDIDVAIYEHDADRLAKAMETDLGNDFFYQTIETDPGYRLTNRKLCLNNTTEIRKGTENWDMHQGIRMDIYPLFEVSANPIGRLRQRCWAMMYFLLLIDRAPINHGKVIAAIATLLQRLLKHSGIKEYAYKVMHAHVGENTGELRFLCNAWSSMKRRYTTETFEPAQRVQFEGRTMPIPGGYDDYLTQMYGDYMALPPLEERTFGDHECLFVDFDHPYTDYRGIYYLGEQQSRS